MEIKVVKSDKNDMEITLDNLTVAEILRAYLDVSEVEFVAWRREHPSKPVLLKVKTSGKTAKKAISDAISAIKKDTDKILKVLKK